MTQEQQLALPKVEFKRLTTDELATIFDNAHNHDSRIQRLVQQVQKEHVNHVDNARRFWFASQKSESHELGEEI